MRFIKPRARLSETEYKALKKRADELVGCTEGSPEEKELKAICDKLAPRVGTIA